MDWSDSHALTRNLKPLRTNRMLCLEVGSVRQKLRLIFLPLCHVRLETRDEEKVLDYYYRLLESFMHSGLVCPELKALYLGL